MDSLTTNRIVMSFCTLSFFNVSINLDYSDTADSAELVSLQRRVAVSPGVGFAGHWLYGFGRGVQKGFVDRSRIPRGHLPSTNTESGLETMALLKVFIDDFWFMMIHLLSMMICDFP